MQVKHLYIICGPNGAGKTTASYTVLPKILQCKEFVNADEIARGLSPFNPESVAIEAGRLMLKRIGELLQKNESFSIETTLSTRSYYKLAISICQSWIRGYWSTIVKLRGQLLLREDKSKKQKYETTSYINLLKNMSNAEHRQMIEKIAYGLEVAEREMLEEKARNNEDVIVCGDDNVIRHIPAKNFLKGRIEDTRISLARP